MVIKEQITVNNEPERWHRKPNSRGPCTVCGCPAKRLKALHRKDADGGWSKTFQVCFGTDSTVEKFGGPGWPNGGHDHSCCAGRPIPLVQLHGSQDPS